LIVRSVFVHIEPNQFLGNFTATALDRFELSSCVPRGLRLRTQPSDAQGEATPQDYRDARSL
jgi:hypothetical protein